MDIRLFATVFSTIFVAELGDKTQLATLLYAADSGHSRLIIFLAAASALVLTSAVGVLLGSALAQHVSARALAWVAGSGFIAIGLWTIIRGASG